MRRQDEGREEDEGSGGGSGGREGERERRGGEEEWEGGREEEWEGEREGEGEGEEGDWSTTWMHRRCRRPSASWGTSSEQGENIEEGCPFIPAGEYRAVSDGWLRKQPAVSHLCVLHCPLFRIRASWIV